MTEQNSAIQSFLNPVPLEVARLDPQFAQQEAVAAFSILHPETANQRLLKDPAFVKAMQDAAAYILNPWQARAELEKDPAFLKYRKDALCALTNGVP